MIIYKSSDVKLSWEHYKDGEGHTHGAPKTCGYVKENLSTVLSHNINNIYIFSFVLYKIISNSVTLILCTLFGIDYTLNDEDDSEENDSTEKDDSRSRLKRQTETYDYAPTKTRCPLLLVADYRFYQEMGASSTKTTINYLVYLSLIVYSCLCTLICNCNNINLLQISLIDRVHKIYNDTLWMEHKEEDGFKGMGFVIKKIVVHSEPTRVRGGETHYNMIREKWDVRTLLEVIIYIKEYSLLLKLNISFIIIMC